MIANAISPFVMRERERDQKNFYQSNLFPDDHLHTLFDAHKKIIFCITDVTRLGLWLNRIYFTLYVESDDNGC